MWIRRLSESAAFLAIVLTAGIARSSPPVAEPSDPLSPFRERFKLGMERYTAGSPADAIAYWKPLYAELGPKTGYRLAYDLAMAYSALGDAVRAAEHLQSFLDQVNARQDTGERLDARVDKEVADAQSRMIDLASALGRIRVSDAHPPEVAATAVQVDAEEPRGVPFTAWVRPGVHTVTFSPGAVQSHAESIEVTAGETVDVGSPAPAVGPHPAVPEPVAEAPKPEPGAARLAASPLPSVVSHPYSPVFIEVTFGLAVAAGITAIPLFAHANALRNSDVAERAETGVIPTSDRDSFTAARTEAYTALGGAIGLAVAATGLWIGYQAGAMRNTRSVEPIVSVDRGRASAALSVRF